MVTRTSALHQQRAMGGPRSREDILVVSAEDQ